MNKREFMGKLSGLLMDISPEERIEALQYYEDYFADAGEENEGEIIAQLESPEALARIIKTELLNNRTGQEREGEYTESGFKDEAYYKDIKYPQQKSPAYEEYRGFEQEAYGEKSKGDLKREKKKLSSAQIILLIIAGVFASPIILGLGSGIIGVMFGILVTVVAVSLSFGIAGLVCVVAGTIVVVLGVINLVIFPAGGILVIGAGIFTFGLGFLLMELSGLCWKGLTMVCSKSTQFVKSLFNKKEVYA